MFTRVARNKMTQGQFDDPLDDMKGTRGGAKLLFSGSRRASRAN